MTDTKFNVNYYVKVKLSDFGREIVKKQREARYAWLPAGIEIPDVKEDESGYSSWQMWDFMNTFGSCMTLGVKMPFDADILMVTP